MSATIEEISGKSFDYVVIGGGTSGLTVAARLAEDPSVSVAVLEAGSANLDDPMITMPAQYARHLGNPKYDWNIPTVPQTHANDNSYFWGRGKTLGGSSAINFYVWSKPAAHDIDAWEKLGNPGWNWARYHEYSKKVEGYTPPNKETAALYKQVDKPSVHGLDGPLKTCFPTLVMGAEFPFQQTMLNTGVPIAKDPLNGDPIGAAMSPSTIDPKTYTRTNAVTAFYLPNKDKANFRVICDALVHRIVSEEKDGMVVAKGVEFEYDGKVHTVFTKKEVIVSAGALKSPQILELSGIGDKSILEPLGIKTVLDLPGVGTNMQEHSFAMLLYEFENEHKFETLDLLFNPEYAASQMALLAAQKGLFTLGLSGFTYFPLTLATPTPSVAHDIIARQKERIKAKVQAGSLLKGQKEQYEIMLEKIDTGKNGDCEVVLFPGAMVPTVVQEGKGHGTMLICTNLQFSRGTIHVKSTDPHDHPLVDPHTFEDEYDLEAHTEMFKYARRLSTIEPWKSTVAKEVIPGPECSSDKDIQDYMKKFLGTVFHTAGSASMLPRELNGVVDPKLKVYGTANIRVVDLSIVPLHFAAHSQATAYTIGEIAADIIKGVL